MFFAFADLNMAITWLRDYSHGANSPNIITLPKNLKGLLLHLRLLIHYQAKDTETSARVWDGFKFGNT